MYDGAGRVPTRPGQHANGAVRRLHDRHADANEKLQRLMFLGGVGRLEPVHRRDRDLYARSERIPFRCLSVFRQQVPEAHLFVLVLVGRMGGHE